MPTNAAFRLMEQQTAAAMIFVAFVIAVVFFL